MTIVPEDGVYDENRVLFSDSNFKFRVRTDANNKKRHFSGKWIKPDDSDEETWTYGDCSATVTTTETKIRLNPDYSSVADFAYYASAVELIKATVRDIALRYPAALCYMGNSEENTIKVDNTTYYKVSNEFGIDIWTKGASESNVEDPLRVLSASYGKYLYGTTNNFVSSFDVSVSGSTCPNSIIATTKIDGTTLYTLLTDEGEHVILSKNAGTRGEPIIRLPKEEENRIYDELDDFEKVLLDRRTKPFFKARLETPYFDGQGYHVRYEDYVWPSYSHAATGFVIPDLSSGAFAMYLERLMALGRQLDEFDSDNIWRMLTHASIKNLDWTFKRSADGETEIFDGFDTTRMKAAIELCGRQFDDLKRYADNIKSVNAITYDEKNNIPDYFLTDSVENDGWDAYYVGPSTDNTLQTTSIYKDAFYSGYTSSDANISFLRRLSLNSDYIQSLKGTKRGLEVIMGLFGMSASDYTITEKIAVAQTFPTESDFRCALPYYDRYYYGDDIYSEWPVIPVTPSQGESYMIPWFDKNMKYGSRLYFQQKGGWENVYSKDIDLSMTEVKKLFPNGDVDLYHETLQYIRYASDLNELTAMTTTKLFTEAVCYVEDISGLYNGYSANDEDQAKIDGGSVFSHYFILKNTDLSPFVGYVDSEYYSCYGWRNIFEDEFDGKDGHTLTCDGTRVLYLESLKTVEKGNNPHVGYGYYDMGEDYLDHYRKIFKSELEDGLFSNLSDEEDDEMTQKVNDMGFKLVDVDVNTKTLSFKDSTTQSELSGNDSDDDAWNEPLYAALVNPEGGDQTDEAASLSIINSKRIHIFFNTNGNQYYKEYIENVVMRYIEQMMPSTAIFSYQFDTDSTAATPAGYVNGRQNELIAAVADGVRVDGENNYMVEWPLPEIPE